MKKIILFVLLLLFIQDIYAQVTITSTEGNANGSYISLKSSFDAINAGVHKGKIVVTINSSIIETSPARLNGSEGFSNYTSIIIMPSTVCTISGNLRDVLLDLNGADNVIIDGRINGQGSTRSLTIQNTYSVRNQHTSSIRFYNGAQHNVLQYLIVEGSGQSHDAGTIWISESTTAESNSFNVINNNEIRASPAGLPNAGIKAYNHSLNTRGNESNAIINNLVHDFFSDWTIHDGIHINYPNTKYLISGNSVYQTAPITDTAIYQGAFISIYYGAGHIIKKNFVGGSAPMAQGNPCTYNGNVTMSGILVYRVDYTDATNLDGNIVSNITFNFDGSIPFSEGVRIFNGFRLLSGKINIGVTETNVIGSILMNADIRVHVSGTSSPVNLIAILCQGSVFRDDYTIFNNKIGGLLATGGAGSNVNIYGIHANAVTSLILSNNTIGGTLVNSIENRASSGSIRGLAVEHQINNAKYVCTGNIVQNLHDNSFGTSNAIIIGIDGSNVYDNNNSYQTNISNNVITNLFSNNINAGNGSVSGIYLNQSILYPNSSQMNAIVAKNEIRNIFSASISTSSTVIGISNNCRFTNMVIDSNKINNLSSFSSSPGQHQTASVQGINSIYTSNAPVSITGNEIGNLKNLNTTQFATSTVGITCFPAGNVSVARNKIFGLSSRNTNSTVAGIGLKGVSGGGTFSLANNMITLDDSTNVYGIINDVNANKVNLYYNSISIGGVGKASNKSAAFFRGAAASTIIESFNNIFYNSRTGGANNYAIINGNISPTSGWSSLNYNNLYTSSPDRITLWNSTPLNLSDYKRLSFQEKCSISQDVEFVNNNGDLHLKDVTSNLNLAGRSIPGATTDFDGDARHLVPTMGADEKVINLEVPVATSAGPISFCQGNKVTLTSSIATGIQWYKDGVAIIGATASSYDAALPGNYRVQLVNECQPLQSNPIQVTVNAIPPTTSVSANGPTIFCAGQEVTLKSSTSNNQWYRNNVLIPGVTGENLVVKQEGAYTVTNSVNGCVSAASAQVNIVVNPLPPVPVISQTGNVLISSATLGNQWFLDGAIIPGATNQQYTPTQEGIYSVQVTLNGCLSSTVALYSFIKTIIPYPNPVRDILNVRITGFSERIVYVMYDAIGRKLREEYVSVNGPSSINIDMKALPAGIYSISIITSEGIATKRILKL